jgi:hypothetical protein
MRIKSVKALCTYVRTSEIFTFRNVFLLGQAFKLDKNIK